MDSASYQVITDFSESQIEQLHSLYQGEWWSTGRTIEDVRLMLQHTDFVFGVCLPGSPKLLAFARVISDRIYKAFIFDVIVHPEHRSAGIGVFLMTHLVNHPDLSRVRHLELYCMPERMNFYRRLGFTTELSELRLLRQSNEPQGSA